LERTSRLKRISVQPESSWLRVPGACPALVSRATFAKANRLQQRVRRPVRSNEQLLEELREILRRRGRLSEKVIRSEPDVHCPAVYIRRFGGLSAAYALVGYKPDAKQRAAEERLRGLRIHSARKLGLKFSDDQLLAHAANLLKREGRLTCEIFDAVKDGPTASTYGRRFGGIPGVYARLGSKPGPRRGGRPRPSL
jgi:hypothetical protein